MHRWCSLCEVRIRHFVAVITGTYPILSCDEARVFEAEYFAGDEAREWAAMRVAGRAVADGVLRDYAELGEFPSDARVLVLVGKGHNAGDALLAAAELRARYPGIAVDVLLVFGERVLRPLTRRALELAAGGGERGVRRVGLDGRDWKAGYEMVLDGVLGFQFRPPLEGVVASVLARVNAYPIRLRAAVDLPSGLDAADAFRADFTYATGSVKSPLLTLENAGRVRFLDLGFPLPSNPIGYLGLGAGVLERVRALRVARSDKRTFGQVLIVAGSRRYAGAALMATLAALRAGAGLVTAAVPESLVPAFVAQVPEAMWFGLPETPEGGLALEGFGLVREAFGRATAVVLGPGMGTERETLALAGEIVAASPRPLVIDADALRPEVVARGSAARVLTPHAGEWARIAEAVPEGAVVVRKGPVTRIETVGAGGGEASRASKLVELVKGSSAGGARSGEQGAVYHSFFGGPVLARGGSGDVLAGLIGGLLAQTPEDALGAAARGVVWHGMAADSLARARGQVAVRTTELLDFLGPVLRDSRP